MHRHRRGPSVLDTHIWTMTVNALSAADLSRLNERRENACCAFFEAVLVPSHRFFHLISERRVLAHDLRSANAYPLPRLRSKRAKCSLINCV